MLSTKNRNLIKELARPRWINGRENPEYGTDNPALEQLMEKIRKEEPWAFHNSATLRHRVFQNEPKQAIEYASFVVPMLRMARS
jgi:hypothetical protein